MSDFVFIPPTDVDPAAPTDATISVSDVTTNNVSTSKHGWTPKAPNDATKFLNGANPPAWAVPAGGLGVTFNKSVTTISTVDIATITLAANSGAGGTFRFTSVATDGAGNWSTDTQSYVWSASLDGAGNGAVGASLTGTQTSIIKSSTGATFALTAQTISMSITAGVVKFSIVQGATAAGVQASAVIQGEIIDFTGHAVTLL